MKTEGEYRMQKFYDFLYSFQKQLVQNQTISDQNSANFAENYFRSQLIKFIQNDDSKLKPEQKKRFQQELKKLRSLFFWTRNKTATKTKQCGEKITTTTINVPQTYYHKFSKEFNSLIDTYMQQCITAYETDEIFKKFIKIYNHNTWDIKRVNAALYCLLYLSKDNKIEKNVLSLLEWFIQTKNNLETNNFEKTHYLLQYLTRDINTDRQKGGNGKSFIIKAITDKLSSFKGLCLNQSGTFPTDKYISDKYSKYWFIFDGEMNGLSHLNKEKTKALLSQNVVTGSNKFEKQHSIRIISNFIGCSNEDWSRSYDRALASRVLQIIADSRLNLRDKKIKQEAEKYLPSYDKIGDSFLYLLGCPINKLIELRDKYQDLINEIENENQLKNESDVWCWDYFYKWFREFGKNINSIRAKDISDQISKTQDRKPTASQIINILLKLKVKSNINFDITKDSWEKTKHRVLWDCTEIKETDILNSFDFQDDSVLSIINVYNYFHKDIEENNSPPENNKRNNDEDINIEDIQTDIDRGDEICGSINIPQANRYCKNKEAKEVFKENNGELELEFLNPIDQKKAEEYIKKGILSTGCGNDTVASMRNFLFEMDNISLEQQKKLANKLSNKIVNRVVYSGKKSLHNRITINREPESIEEYKFIWNELNKKFFNNKADNLCSNPARRCRSPYIIRSQTGQQQTLLFNNNNILYCYDYYHNLYISYEKLKELQTKIYLEKYDNNKNHSVINHPKIKHYLDTSYLKIKGNGDSNISLWTAILICLKANDNDTLEIICNKARSEHWTEKEIQSKIESAKKRINK